MMVDSQNPYAAPQADTTPPPGTEWLQGVSPSLTKTGWGLSFVYYGIVIVLLSAMALGGSVGIAVSNQETAELMMAVASAGILIGTLLMFVGPLLCLSVPAESRAKGFVIGSVLVQIPGILNAIVYQFVPKSIPVIVTGFTQLLGTVGFVLFVLFLNQLAQYIGRDDYCRRTRNILKGFTMVIVLGMVFGTALYAQIFGMGMFFGISFLLGTLIVFVLYANLVNDLRKTLAAKK